MAQTLGYNPKRGGMVVRDAARDVRTAEREKHLPTLKDLKTPAAARLAARVAKYKGNVITAKRIHAEKHHTPYYLVRKRVGFTLDKKETFIFTLAELGTVADAANAAGISVKSAYAHRAPKSPTYDADFADAWSEAVEEFNAGIEGEIYKRAVLGELEPVFGGPHKDQIVGHIRRKSDSLLTTLAKRRMPEFYGDKISVNGPGRPITSTEIAPGVDIVDMTPEQRKALKQFLTAMDGVDRSDVIDVEAEEIEDNS